jgi:hypothetical protein
LISLIGHVSITSKITLRFRRWPLCCGNPMLAKVCEEQAPRVRYMNKPHREKFVDVLCRP